MLDKEVMAKLRQYLEEEKVFVINPMRAREISLAFELAQQVFPGTEIKSLDDPLQMGALIMHVDRPEFAARGIREIENFSDLIALTDNFEIYAIDEETVRFAAVFNDAYVRIDK